MKCQLFVIFVLVCIEFFFVSISVLVNVSVF